MPTNKDLTDLTAAGPIDPTSDLIYVLQGGADRKGPAPAEFLAATRDYYVRTDGNDSHTGLANTAGAAFLTIQHAINVAIRHDMRAYGVNIHIADGTYTEDLRIVSIPAQITLTGNTTTPANVVVSSFYSLFGFPTLSGIKFNGLVYVENSYLGIDHCTIAGNQLYANRQSTIDVGAGMTFSGNSTYAIHAAGSSYISVNNAVAVSGTPAYSGAFVQVNGLGYVQFSAQPTGSATGTRALVDGNSVLNLVGNADTWLPGNATVAPTNGGRLI